MFVIVPDGLRTVVFVETDLSVAEVSLFFVELESVEEDEFDVSVFV